MSYRVLLVEDDAIASMTLEKMFNELGYTEIKSASNYNNAIGLIADWKPDLLILDVYLKGRESGVDLARQANSDRPDLPIIFITASSESTTMNQINQTKYHKVLKKPYDFQDLKRAVVELTSN
jgi:CheY-like chemotaxis protein